MSNINFFTKGKYIVLPTKKNPRVYLNLKNKIVSFKLYNPFSKKAKFLKKIAYIFPYFNILYYNIKSEFIKYLEQKLNKSFDTSVYLSSDKDKVIIQLINNDKIFGYLKISLTDVGRERILNELKAIKLLKHINPIKIIYQGEYKNCRYFISENINGKINYLNDNEVKLVLDKFRRKKYYKYDEHPRIIWIKKELKKLNIEYYNKIFSKINIKDKLELVYEHGDFTPWNIIKQGNDYIIFDFEYFFENGLEYFDKIKYYFQYFNLIEKLKGERLIINLLNKIKYKYENEVFILFLLKEIIQKSNEKKSIELENNLLNLWKYRI